MVVIIMNLPPTDDTKREGVGSFSYPPATSVGFGVPQSQGTQLVSSSTTQQQSAPDGMSPAAAASMMVGGEPTLSPIFVKIMVGYKYVSFRLS